MPDRVVLFDAADPLRLDCGRTLAPVEVAYSTYGTSDGANAVLICHALTGDAEATDWWSTMVGPGRPVDTDRFYVICPNLLGGCRGTTGPSSTDPATGEAYGLRFPPIAMADLVTVHRALLRHLGVERLFAAVGGSMGGMQVLEHLLAAPGEIERAVIVAGSSRLTAQNVGLSVVARDAIMRDPDFRGGDFARHGVRPDRGMGVARKLGHITYLSRDGMARKFPRVQPSGPPPADAAEWLGTTYDVESYLEHQEAVFLARFDPLTYLYLSRIMDAFEPFAGGRRADPATRVLVGAFDSDWRFGPDHAAPLAEGLRAAGVTDLVEHVWQTDLGHDAFLLEVDGYQDAVRAFLRR